MSSGCFIRRQPWRNQLHPAIQASVRRSNTPMVLHVQPAFWSPCPAACASMAGQHGVCLAAPGANMENHLVSLHVCVFSRLWYFFLIFTSLSLFFLVTVLVLFWYPFHTRFCISSFLFIVASFHFFLILFFGSPLFISPYFWGKKKIHCMCLFFLYFPFFLSPNPLPFHSIGTREVVTQKNLSGLVPVRDLRLDPSLLCSIPLLALSPNLLIVWLFLSIAYLVAKLRCK